MRSNEKKRSSQNSQSLAPILEWDEADLSDEILSEGTKIHLPMVVEHLEENMSHIPLSKNHPLIKENEFIINFDDNFESNLANWVQRNRKVQTAYRKIQNSQMLLCAHKEEVKHIETIDHSIPASQTTLTLKSEISHLLRMLAENRKLKWSTGRGEISNKAHNFSHAVEDSQNNSKQNITAWREPVDKDKKKVIKNSLSITVNDLEPCENS